MENSWNFLGGKTSTIGREEGCCARVLPKPEMITNAIVMVKYHRDLSMEIGIRFRIVRVKHKDIAVAVLCFNSKVSKKKPVK